MLFYSKERPCVKHSLSFLFGFPQIFHIAEARSHFSSEFSAVWHIFVPRFGKTGNLRIICRSAWVATHAHAHDGRDKILAVLDFMYWLRIIYESNRGRSSSEPVPQN